MFVQVALQEGLENVQNFFQRNSCRLPLSPSLVAKELNLKVTHTHTDPEGAVVGADSDFHRSSCQSQRVSALFDSHQSEKRRQNISDAVQLPDWTSGYTENLLIRWAMTFNIQVSSRLE